MRAVSQCVIVLAMTSFLWGCAERSVPGVDTRSESEPSHALVGQKAPLFKAAMLDESPFALADHLGKSVIILDFWATWCGPCVRALPVMAEVAAEYKSKGVELFAVNLQDDAEGVRAFLKENKLDIQVVMDRDGGVGTLYQAEAIPQTVIIGKDGTVERVHVGVSPNLKSELVGDLDALLAGKKLAADSPVETRAAEQRASSVAGTR
jgi:thiol-disulfide isomerase/thioredoxin